MSSSTAFLALGLLALGICVSAFVFLLTSSLERLPVDDRTWRDPPPPAWRPVWMLVRWLGPPIEDRLPDRARAAIESSLRRAGLEFAVTAGQYMAVRCIYGGCAAFGAFVGAVLLARLDVGTLVAVSVGAALFGFTWPAMDLRDRAARRRSELLRSLPFCLDVVTLCVEAGLNLHGALAQAASKGPTGALRSELQRCLRDVRAGKGRAAALQAMAERVGEPGLSQFVNAVVQAEALGMSLGPVLRAQADQRRNERFLRAEKLAMQAPVKLLMPLIACIFPCTFIVLFFPIAMKFLQPGL